MQSFLLREKYAIVIIFTNSFNNHTQQNLCALVSFLYARNYVNTYPDNRRCPVFPSVHKNYQNMWFEI